MVPITVCLPVPGTPCVEEQFCTAEPPRVCRAPRVLAGFGVPRRGEAAAPACSGRFLHGNKWLERTLRVTETLQHLIEENPLGIPTTPQVRTFAACPGKSRRGPATAQLLAKGGEVLSGSAWIPSTSSCPGVCVAHSVPHRQVKSQTSSYQSDRRGKALNVLSVTTELFILCITVIRSILCGQLCVTLSLLGTTHFTCPLPDCFILLSHSVPQVLLIFPQSLLPTVSAGFPHFSQPRDIWGIVTVLQNWKGLWSLEAPCMRI